MVLILNVLEHVLLFVFGNESNIFRVLGQPALSSIWPPSSVPPVLTSMDFLGNNHPLDLTLTEPTNKPLIFQERQNAVFPTTKVEFVGTAGLGASAQNSHDLNNRYSNM